MEELGDHLPAYLSISIVSHLQADMVALLLKDLSSVCLGREFDVVLTLNLPEIVPFDTSAFPFPVRIIRNAKPMGFGANHNQAFAESSGKFFCILNPDIRLVKDPFGPLLQLLQQQDVGLVAPAVTNAQGVFEDSARYFPTPWGIFLKFFGRSRRLDYSFGEAHLFPEWTAGMFMLLPRSVFAQLGGFDVRYFLYYEDVDFCARIRLAGYRIALTPAVHVIHNAQRRSHRNIRFLYWHVRSMLRFFMSPVYQALKGRAWV